MSKSRVASLTLFSLQMMTLGLAMGRDVYFDRNGHCNAKPFNLTSGEEFLLRSVDLGRQAEPVNCRLHFQAETGHGVCIKFEKGGLSHCGVDITLEREERREEGDEMGKGRKRNGFLPWEEFNCYTGSLPDQICTPSQKVNIILHLKPSLHQPNDNATYDFVIKVSQNGSTTVIAERGSAFDAFALTIGIVVVVVVLLAIVVLILCCCCCCCRDGKESKSVTTSFTSQSKPNYESYTLPSAIDERKWH